MLATASVRWRPRSTMAARLALAQCHYFRAGPVGSVVGAGPVNSGGFAGQVNLAVFSGPHLGKASFKRVNLSCWFMTNR